MPAPTFWKPKPLSTYEAYVQSLTNQLAKYKYAAAKNIGYNLQYVEYLVHILDTENLHSVVKTQMQKTLVITSVSIIESIFYCVLKKDNRQSTNSWKLVGKPHKTSIFSDNNGKKMMLETSILEEVSSFDVEMTLDTMTKKVERKDLLGTGHELYKNLNHLRKLRNKIHIHAFQQSLDTDWNNFNDRTTELTKSVLFQVLQSRPFTANPYLFKFLNKEEEGENLEFPF